MKRGVLAILLLELFIFILSMNSCCRQEYEIIGDGELLIQDIDYLPIDTIKGPFVVIGLPEVQLVYHNAQLSSNNALYGLTCEYPVANSIVEESIRLTMDQNILVQNSEVPSGENLLTYGELIYDSFSPNVNVRFDSTFIQNVDILKGDYMIELSFETEDGLSLSTSQSIYIDL